MNRFRRLTLLFVFALAISCGSAAAQALTLPVRQGSVKFAVIGDSGDGGSEEYDVARQMATYHQRFPFGFVIMLGDNIYGAERPQDFQKKFEVPYQALIQGGVEFHAALGNHDDPNQRYYKLFGMDGERYYTFKKDDVRFFVLDSNYMDPPQVDWLEKALKGAGSGWKIAYFHHPLYSNGMHGSETDLRTVIEPLFIKYGVNAVFAGHEHFYERIRPQHGIYYFIEGAGGKLRKGDIHRDALTQVGFDTDRSFMLVEITENELYFQTISRTGKTVDSGTLPKQGEASHAAGERPQRP